MASRKRVIYQPPQRSTVSEYARQVCEHLADTCDPSYKEPEVVSGLTEFLMVVGTILAKRLNEVREREEKLAEQSE